MMKSEEFLKSRNTQYKLLYLKEVPRTAQDVERIYGCSLHEVLKTLVFAGDKEPVIAVLPGDKKVDLEKLKKASGQTTLRMAKPDEVKQITGYTIGGVTPFGLNAKKVIDKGVFDIPKTNIGSGIAEIGIELSSDEMKKAWDGIIAEII